MSTDTLNSHVQDASAVGEVALARRPAVKAKMTIAKAKRLKGTRLRSNDELLTNMAMSSWHGRYHAEYLYYDDAMEARMELMAYGTCKSIARDALELAVRALPPGTHSFDKVLALSASRHIYADPEVSYVNDLIVACDTLDQPDRTYVAPPPPVEGEQFWGWGSGFSRWTTTMARGKDEETVARRWDLARIEHTATTAQKAAYTALAMRRDDPARLTRAIRSNLRHLTLQAEGLLMANIQR